jgi:GTP cyclohydrolase I
MKRDGAPGRVDVERMVGVLLGYLGENAAREGLADTPGRVIRALEEQTCGYKENPKAILATRFTETYDEMVVVSGIDFWSLCEHHLMPFHGTVSVGYIPNGRVVGLSKIPRLVHCFARRLQVQERMTEQIANALQLHLEPRGVAVLVKGEHLCMKARGVRSDGRMTTSSLLGVMREPGPRAEFLKLA